MTPIYFGKAKNGKFIPTDHNAVKMALCKLQDKDIEITIKPRTKKRSGNQNRYYRGVVIELICEYTGEDNERTHHFLRGQFLSFVNDKGLIMVRSTTELSTAEMEDYLEKCRRFAAENNIYVPLPNEVDY